MTPMFLNVHRGSNDTEDPFIPGMLCKDVVKLCEEPCETDCCLAGEWRGSDEPRATDQGVMTENVETSVERNRKTGFSVIPLDASLSELQDLATRQQQQIDAQQQLLAFKEHQLRYRKQHDLKQDQEASQRERLLQLQEHIKNQEARLLLLWALRSQVEQKRVTNAKLVEEIEQTTSLIHQKQNELQSAEDKVEDLSKQLEALRNTHLDSAIPSHPYNFTSAAEVKGLNKDLQLRSELNQEQRLKLQQQKDSLRKRHLEVAAMDQRLAELRDRLTKKKATLQQKESLPVASESINPQHELSSRVAAVGPYIKSASRSSSQHPAGPSSKEVLVKFTYPDGTATLPVCLKPPPRPDVPAVDSSRPGQSTEKQLKDAQPFSNGPSKSTVPPPVPSKPKPSPAPPTFSKPEFYTGTFPGKKKLYGSQLKDTSVLSNSSLPLHSNRGSSPAVAVRPYTPEPTDGPPPELHKPKTLAGSSIFWMYTQQASPGKAQQANGQGTLPSSKPKAYGKPVPPAEGKQQRVSSGTSGLSDFNEGEADDSLSAATDDKAVEAETPRPLSPSKLLPFVSDPHRNSDVDSEGFRRRLQHAPRPLKKRSSVVEPEGPIGPNIQKLLYQKTTLAAMEAIPMETISAPGENGPVINPDSRIVRNDVTSRVKEKSLAGIKPSDGLTSPPLAPLPAFPEPSYSHSQDMEEEENMPCTLNKDSFPHPSCGEKEKADGVLSSEQPIPQSTDPPGKQSILHKPGAAWIDRGKHVQFSPLALLLDSALEGEFDLVQRVIYEVDDASRPNDEGITALHNAVCAGHFEIVKFLVQFGVNVNAADSDGWTPLHCAASCNSFQICRFLVESGAAVFAATYSDMQTAADKCEEMEEGYAQCSKFLYGVQEKMGVMNRGVVYALWSYEPQHHDELGFSEGDCLTVLSQEEEREWWWARCGDHEGFIPRNLLGLYPRIKPRQRSLA
ncbi:apoptosis-stimulating of p53 protein 2-like [Cyprinodon tularosa]|uniref:apoptosis-stimulating of p53 protein 2-like n=1 Tax=Cyprinodon tularosa TaxID=77115 RepID=UPI0018E25681|nr:apoptosis-stimulating of p53 protein 2-like [Cyprinodon tularosa]